MIRPALALSASVLSALSIAGAFEPSLRQTGIDAPRIGIIDKPRDGECGCSLRRLADYRKRKRRYVFISDQAARAQMNIDGRDVELRQMKQRAATTRVGQRSYETYAAGKLSVRVDYIATKVCPTYDRDCAANWYDATITVSRGGRRRRIGTKGACGC